MFHARHRTFMRSMLFGGLLTLGAGAASAQTTPSTPPAEPQTPAVAQPAATPDEAIAIRIRKAIKDDKAITAYSDSVRMMVSGGMVTIKGAVRSEAEKKAIGAKADAIAGEANVMNNLVVAPDSPALPKPPTN